MAQGSEFRTEDNPELVRETNKGVAAGTSHVRTGNVLKIREDVRVVVGMDNRGRKIPPDRWEPQPTDLPILGVSGTSHFALHNTPRGEEWQVKHVVVINAGVNELINIQVSKVNRDGTSTVIAVETGPLLGGIILPIPINPPSITEGPLGGIQIGATSLLATVMITTLENDERVGMYSYTDDLSKT